MATPSKIQLSPSEKPEFWTSGMNDKSAAKASSLLQENHENHHVFFNDEGFHNHIVHQLLTLYALGASPETITKHYERNKSYQRPAEKLEERIVQEMHDPAKFNECLGKEEFYHDFVVYFQKEMESKGWEAVVNEYLFKGDERADNMLVRTFSGFLHPLIQLGFGIEFSQPAIIAEGLAQAAVHSAWIGTLFHAAEAAAKKNGNPSKSLVALLDDIHADQALANSARFNDANKIRDGIMTRAPDAMLAHASQYAVTADSLRRKTAEMINAVAYYTAAAQRPPHQVKIDFFLMHCTNSSLFFTRFLDLPFLSTETKIRLLEWKGRSDLVLYASRGSPALSADEIVSYQAKRPSANGNGNGSGDVWDGIISRVSQFEDDGHAAKLVRAVAHGKRVCEKWEGGEEFRVKGEMWDRIGEMVIDSVEAGGPTFVRSAGFEEAWKEVPERRGAML